MTRGTYGRSYFVQFAEYDPESSSWKTWPDIGLWGSTSFSQTLPPSGMTRGGRAFERRTSAPRTSASGSGSLPTPQASDWKEPNHSGSNSQSAMGLATVVELLPTPTASDSNGAGQHGTGGADLRTQVALLPTPRATDGTKGGPNQRGSSGDLMLPSAVQLLPTPTAMDSHSSGGNSTSNVTLTDATVRTRLGARTNPRLDDGNESQAELRLDLQNLADEAASDWHLDSLNG